MVNANINHKNADSSKEESEFEVERVLDRKLNGADWYRIKFVGFDNRYNKWLPLSSLNCDNLIKEFNKIH